MSAQDREDALGDYACGAAQRLDALYSLVDAWVKKARVVLYGECDGGTIGTTDEQDAEDMLAWFGDIADEFESM